MEQNKEDKNFKLFASVMNQSFFFKQAIEETRDNINQDIAIKVILVMWVIGIVVAVILG